MKKDRKGRITDDNITELKPGQRFVFGSNESGIHGAGAALLAKEKFEAKEGVGWGPTGKCFAIPTKSWDIRGTLPIAAIECYVARFIEYCMLHPEETMLVTEVGCGLAGYTPQDIAPLFAGVDMIKNICLPQSFWDVIDQVYREDLAKYMEIENDGGKNELSNF